MKRNFIETQRIFTRGIKAQAARLAGHYCRTQAEAEAGIPEGSQKFLKARGNKRYYVYWAPGNKEAQVSKEWRE